MLKSTVFLSVILVCLNADASVGLLLAPTLPEVSQTQVLVIRDGKTTTVATRSLESPEAIRIFPIYPGMKNIRVGQVAAEAFEALNHDTSPTFERWVEADPCGPDPAPTTTSTPTLAPTSPTSPANLLKIAELKKNLRPLELSENQIAALIHEEKLGAEFLILKSTEGQVPSVSYDADLLELPTRLGQLNQSKIQHLRVFIVGSERFEVSNFWMSYLPTNIELRPEITDFGKIHQTVVSKSDEQKTRAFWVEFSGALQEDSGPRFITRLSHSSASGKLDDNLTLSPANPLVGGTQDNKPGAFGGEKSDFKIRYFSKNKFDAQIDCAAPKRERWKLGKVESADAWPNDAPGLDLSQVVLAPIAEIYVSPAPQNVVPEVVAQPTKSAEKPIVASPKPGCSSAAMPGEAAGFFSILVGWFLMRRRN